MKGYLFTLVASSSNLITSAIQALADWLIFVNSETGFLILKMLDKNRINHATSIIEQQEEITELNVLSQINLVVEDAVIQGEWNQDHENDLNIIANILFNDHDWKESRIQSYIHGMINDADARINSSRG